MLAAWTSSRSGETAGPSFVGGRRRRPTTDMNSGCSAAVAARPGPPHWFWCTAFRRRASTISPWPANWAPMFVLDFPGYGLSDKPPAPHVYSLYDDARLLVYAITQVWKLTEFRMLTHDRGSSVGMIALEMLAAQDPPAVPVDLVLTNANIYLPLSNLTVFQTALLDPATGRDTAAATTPEMLAAGLGVSTFIPRRTLEDPEIAALARCFAHNDGIRVLPDTIQYLNERAADETGWLEALSKNHVNTTVVWGIHDNVSPLRVPNYVWQTYLKNKPGRNRYWVVPGADHYLQCDEPAQLAQIVRLTARGGDIPLRTLGNQPGGAVLVDESAS